MNKLYQALEICLNDIQEGADIQTVLRNYPDLADELQPLLEASLHAKELAVPTPSQEIITRNRTRLLQHAAEIREQKFAPTSRRIWSVPLRRALVTLVVVTLLFISGTGLVRASSNTLPGDSLYSVKRTWENVLLILTFDVDKREALELDHEYERLEELHELYAIGRSSEVEFSGYVTRQTGDQWRVSGITVFISTQTQLPDGQIQVGAAVHVKGRTENHGVAATHIESLPAGSKLPQVEDLDPGNEEEKHEGSNPQVGDGPDPEAQDAGTTSTLVPGSELEAASFEGVVTSLENDFVVVNGVVIDTRNAEIMGIPRVGAVVKVEGYYDVSGIFIAMKIEFMDGGSGGGGKSSEDNNNGNGGGNSNGGSDDDGNDNDNHNDNGNDNDNNSGPGGGG